MELCFVEENEDLDKDGLENGVEVNVVGSDPLDEEIDGEGISDGLEVS